MSLVHAPSISIMMIIIIKRKITMIFFLMNCTLQK